MTALQWVSLVWLAVVMLVGIRRFQPSRDLRDPQLVRNPSSGLWSTFRFLDGTEYTEAGLRWRNRFLIWIVVAFFSTLWVFAVIIAA
jgi:hypothetical protein